MSQGYDGLPSYYGQSSNPLTPNFGFCLAGMDPILAENFVIADTAIAAGGGSKIQVNGFTVSNPNFNNTAPAAPTGNVNILWQVSGSSVSAYVPSTPPGGLNTQIQYNNNGVFGGASGFTWNNITNALQQLGVTGLGPYSSPGLINSIVANTGLPGPGVPNTKSTLDISDQYIGNSSEGSIAMISAGWNIQPTVGSSSSFFTGMTFETNTQNSTVQIGEVIGYYQEVFHQGTGAVGTMEGIEIDAYVQTPNTGNLGAVGTLAVLTLFTGNFSSSGSINDHYSLWIQGVGAPTSGGSTSHFRAIQIDSVANASADSYAIYATDGKNYFGGSVQLNSTLIDGTSSVGTNGQVLSSTVTGTKWITVSSTPPWSSLTNAVANLILNNAGFSTTFNQTSPVPWTWANATAGTALSQNSSPVFQLEANYFSGSVSQPDTWSIGSVLGQGVNGSSLLEILHSGTTGLAGVLIGNSQFTTSIESSPYLILGGSYEVSASLGTFAEDNWYIQNVIGAGANGVSALTISHLGSEGASNVVFSNITNVIEQNTTLATSGTTNSSPFLEFLANYWTGAVSAVDTWSLQSSLASGTNGASTLTIAHSGSTGNAQVIFPKGSGTVPGIAFSATQGIGQQTSTILQFIGGGSGSAVQFGTTVSSSGLQITCAANPVIQSTSGGTFVTLEGLTNGQANQSSVVLANSGTSFTGTANNGIVNIQSTFAPTTGTSPWFGLSVTPTINQTGTGNGSIRVIAGYAVNTSLLGTEYLLALGTTTATGVGGTLTDKLLVDSNGTMYQINQTAGTPSSTNTSPLHLFEANYYSGSLSEPDTWSIGSILGQGVNGSSLLEILHAGSTGPSGVLIGNSQFTTSVENSPYLILAGSYEVSVSLNTFAEDNWYLQNVIGAGANGASNLTFSHVGTEGAANVLLSNISNLIVQNTTLATASTTNASPLLEFQANYWTGAASALDTWSLQSSLAAGTNGAPTLTIAHSGSTGTPTLSLSGINISAASQVLSGKITSYNGISTVASGIPAEYAQVNATAQSANIGVTTLYSVPAGGAGMYRISFYEIVTQAATTSSTLPSLVIAWGDLDNTAAQSSTTVPSTPNGNSLTTKMQGTMLVSAEAGVAISYSTTSYASNGTTAMQYALHIRVEFLG